MTSVAIIAVLLVVFVAIALGIQTTVRHVIHEQEMVRRLDADHSRILTLQVDEETGLRGYTITGSRSFLEPFYAARAEMPGALTALEAHLRGIAPSLVPLVEAQRRDNDEWVAQYALPSIAHAPHANSFAAEVNAKRIVDHMRVLSDTVALSLASIADAQDRAASQAVTWILVVSSLFGFLLATALLFYLTTQANMGRALSEQAADYERLRRIAATLQEAFLVEPLPKVPALSLDAVYAPALEEARVGGDWYGVFPLPDGRLYFSMGDVAGHGVEASVTMARTRQTILAIAMHELDPAVVLARANEVIRLRTDIMITALVGFVNPETFEVTYASAGHPPPLLVSERGEAVYLPTSGAPLGITPDPAVRTFVRRAARGSMLVLYTDGIVEFDRDLLRGEQRLSQVAATVIRDGDERPAAAILRRSLGTALQRDDIALLAIRFVDAPGEERVNGTGQALLASWDIDRGDPQSARNTRSAFVGVLEVLAVADVLGSETILGELVANALEHGSGSIHVRLYETPRGLLLAVADAGKGVASASRRLEKMTPHAMAQRGRGLHIVRALARDVRVAEDPNSIVFALLPEERASESA